LSDIAYDIDIIEEIYDIKTCDELLSFETQEITYDVEIKEENCNITYENILVISNNCNYFTEILQGEIDNINKVFYTSYDYIPNSTIVFRNGLLQQRGIHYEELGNQLIQFNESPNNQGFEDNLLIMYIKREE